MVNKELKELMKRHDMVLYEFADDEFSNTNEKYIKYNAKYNEYRVEYEGYSAGFGTISEARDFREKFLKERGVVLVDR